MVVPARRHENSPLTTLRHFKAQHIAPESKPALDIGNLEMDMTDTSTGVDRAGGGGVVHENLVRSAASGSGGCTSAERLASF
jgi:hypothetical protein